MPSRTTRFAGPAKFFSLGLLFVIAATAVCFALFSNFSGEEAGETPLLANVTRGSFQHVILQTGEIESSNSVDVRCEVRAREGSAPGDPSTTILEVIPEGSLVQEGDWLLTLDSSVLEQEKTAEQIVLNAMEAEMISAKANYDAALLDKQEFEKRGLSRISVNLAGIDSAIAGSAAARSASAGSRGNGANSRGGQASSSRSASSANSASSTSSSSAGGSSASNGSTSAGSTSASGRTNSTQQSASAAARNSSNGANGRGDAPAPGPVPLVNPSYGELKQFIENEIFAADESLKKARLAYESMKRRVARGLADNLQLEGVQFRVRAAENVRDLANQKLDALENYTKKKILVQLEANFEVANVGYRSAQRSYEEQLAKVQAIDDQIAKCRVLAPAPGQVVYKNVQSGRAGSEFVVEPGAAVRENQVIITLPDPTAMRVRTLVEESQINLVKAGMPAFVRIGALDQTLPGEVTKVNKYAEPTSWFSGGAGKKYLTLVRLVDLPPNIRVGFTAQVGIIIEERRDALQIPFQAVYTSGGKTFCLVKRGDRWETQEVVASTSDDRMVVLDEGATDAIQEGDLVAINPARHVDLFDPAALPQKTAGPVETNALFTAGE